MGRWKSPYWKGFFAGVATMLVLTFLAILAFITYGRYKLAELTKAQIAEYEAVVSPATSLPAPPTVSRDSGAPLGNVDYQWTLERADGSLAALSDFRGKVVLLNLFSRTCRPCLTELPALERLSRALDGQAIVLIVSTDPLDDYRQFVEYYKPRLEIYRAHEPAPPELATSALPTTYVIDSAGMLRYRHVGAANWAAASFTDYLRTLRPR